MLPSIASLTLPHPFTSKRLEAPRTKILLLPPVRQVTLQHILSELNMSNDTCKAAQPVHRHHRPAVPEQRPVRAKRSLCRVDNCHKPARKKGLCFQHGGKSLCKSPGCVKCAHRGGFCIAHGGGRRCEVLNCPKSAQAGGKCYVHGGGRRCAMAECSNASKFKGYCTKHSKMINTQHQQ